MAAVDDAVVDLTADDDDDDILDVLALPPPDRRAPRRARAGSDEPVLLEDQPRGATAARPAVTEDSNNPAPGTAANGRRRQLRDGAAVPLAALPLWHGKLGGGRLAAELKTITAAFEGGQLPQLVEAPAVGVNIYEWRIKLRNFDASCPGGRRLNADLRKLAPQHGQGHLLLEVTFPAAYPEQPPFLRMLKPRCVQFSGQLTTGGAVCMQALAPSGGPNSWHSDRCFQDILVTAIHNMLHSKTLLVSSSTGDPLSGGPLRVHLGAPDVMEQYSEAEARSTFQRMITMRGWDAAKPGQPPQPVNQQNARQNARQPAPQRPDQQHQPQRAAQPRKDASKSASSQQAPQQQQQMAAQQAAQQAAPQRRAAQRDPSPEPRQRAVPAVRMQAAAVRRREGTADSSASDSSVLATSVEVGDRVGRAAKRSKRGMSSTPAPATQVDLTDDATVAMLEQQMEMQMVAAAVAADEATARVVDLTSSQPEAAGAVAAKQAAVSDAQAELEQARAAMAKLQREMEAMQAEKAAAAAVGAPLAPRPDHWTPAKDASSIVEYVTLDMRSQQGQVGEEAETILRAVERCHQVARERVLQIDRVQNLRLWTKYVIRRNEVVELAGQQRSKESLLFHGSNPAVLSLITREGFDIRVANMGGALGAGAYFAQHVSYSLQYINRVPQGVTIPGLAVGQNVAHRVRQAQMQVSHSMQTAVQRQLQQAQATETAALQQAAQAQQAAAAAKATYNAAATQYNAAVDFHNQCAAMPYRAPPGWSHALSQQQLAMQHGQLQGQQAALQQAGQQATLQDQAARVAQASVQRLQIRLAQVQQMYATRHAAQQQQAVAAATPAAEVPGVANGKGPAPAGRQSSSLQSPGGDCIMMTLCRVTLGRVVQGGGNMRRPPDGADSTTNANSIFAVYDNAQAYPEYVLWLAPAAPVMPQ